jgi:hypothetical protein
VVSQTSEGCKVLDVFGFTFSIVRCCTAMGSYPSEHFPQLTVFIHSLI